MGEPAGICAAANAAEDEAQKRYRHQRPDRGAAKGDPARPVAEGDEDGQARTE